jgi:hypothetical protein
MSNSSGTADVTCPAGDIATGGGGTANSADTGLIENSPTTNANGKAVGWHIKANGNGSKSRTVFALCAPDA